MATATKHRTGAAYVQFWERWTKLPAFRELSGQAAKLLIVIMAGYRPGKNGFLEWSDRKAGEAIGKSEATGRRALEELTEKGWITVERFGKTNPATPTRYALAMFPNDASAEPAGRDFENWPGK